MLLKSQKKYDILYMNVTMVAVKLDCSFSLSFKAFELSCSLSVCDCEWKRGRESLVESMAAGMAITSKACEGTGEYYNGRMTLFVVVSCMIAATGGVIFGYDIGISGLSFSFSLSLSLSLSLS